MLGRSLKEITGYPWRHVGKPTPLFSGDIMPVRKSGNKWKIGSGKALYDSKAEAERAYQGYLYSKYGKKRKKQRS